MLHVSFGWTAEAYADGSKTETRRFWKAAHAAKFKPGTVFMGIDKDFRAGGKRLHPARVVFCRPERLGDMSEESFVREGGTRYWPDRRAYIDAMGGPDRVPYVLRFVHRIRAINFRVEYLTDDSGGIPYATVVEARCAEEAKEIFCAENPHVTFYGIATIDGPQQ